jgi:hypothetical protein
MSQLAWVSQLCRRSPFKKDSYLQAQFYRIKARRGPKKPVWRILDDGKFTLVLANAAHVKNVPFFPILGEAAAAVDDGVENAIDGRPPVSFGGRSPRHLG